jgi:TPR repeat protein
MKGRWPPARGVKGLGEGMDTRLVALVLCLAFALPPSSGAQTFLAPTAPPPKGAAPHTSQGTSQPSQKSRRQSTPAAPPSECVTLTKDWVDYRPMLDLPASQGRSTSEILVSSLSACRTEQIARPNDLRVAFLLARTLEVNHKTTSATALFRQLSDAGYAPATTQLARAYHFGSGVAADQVQACDLYVQAAKAGDIWAMNPAADCLSFQDYAHDPRLACRFFQRAQASGTFQTTDLTKADYCP